jgi:hypothetical protein
MRFVRVADEHQIVELLGPAGITRYEDASAGLLRGGRDVGGSGCRIVGARDGRAREALQPFGNLALPEALDRLDRADLV